MTYYEVLEIDSRASTQEIERAFRRVARKVHPDLNAGDAAKAEARMKLLNEIRDTLTDPLLRSGYDERLRLESLRRERPAPPRAAPPEAPRAAPATPRPVVRSAAASRKRSPALLVGLLLGALGAGVVTVALLASPSYETVVPPPDGGEGAPLLVAPVRSAAARAVDEVDAKAHAHARGRGVIHLGSSADDVLRVLGPPDSYEAGQHPGESVLHFGRLHLEMKNGRVVGGDAAVR